MHKLKVLFHDNCFDGASSAAVFSRFYRERVRPDVEFSYEGLSHKAGGAPIDAHVFTGAENVIVDFRYSQDPRLTWWFDHHISAFQQAGDEEHFKQDTSGKKFHDPHRKSCTKYLAEIARDRFGWDPTPMAELIHWAELIDGASFESPQQAVELAEPALKLMSVLEASREPGFVPRVIGDLQTKSLAEIVASPYIAEPLKPLLERHVKSIELVRKKVKYENGIVTFDVADEKIESLNKFISYYLHPDARYTVWVGAGASKAKISIGSNPWKKELRKHDLASIAGRYGGGGHPVVAAVSFGPGEVEKARKIAAEIVAELNS